MTKILSENNGFTIHFQQSGSGATAFDHTGSGSSDDADEATPTETYEHHIWENSEYSYAFSAIIASIPDDGESTIPESTEPQGLDGNTDGSGNTLVSPVAQVTDFDYVLTTHKVGGADVNGTSEFAKLLIGALPVSEADSLANGSATTDTSWDATSNKQQGMEFLDENDSDAGQGGKQFVAALVNQDGEPQNGSNEVADENVSQESELLTAEQLARRIEMRRAESLKLYAMREDIAWGPLVWVYTGSWSCPRSSYNAGMNAAGERLAFGGEPVEVDFGAYEDLSADGERLRILSIIGSYDASLYDPQTCEFAPRITSKTELDLIRVSGPEEGVAGGNVRIGAVTVDIGVDLESYQDTQKLMKYSVTGDILSTKLANDFRPKVGNQVLVLRQESTVLVGHGELGAGLYWGEGLKDMYGLEFSYEKQWADISTIFTAGTEKHGGASSTVGFGTGKVLKVSLLIDRSQPFKPLRRGYWKYIGEGGYTPTPWAPIRSLEFLSPEEIQEWRLPR